MGPNSAIFLTKREKRGEREGGGCSCPISISELKHTRNLTESLMQTPTFTVQTESVGQNFPSIAFKYFVCLIAEISVKKTLNLSPSIANNFQSKAVFIECQKNRVKK